MIVSDPREEELESDSDLGLLSITTSVWYFRKSHERVVWSWKTESGKTDKTPGS
uniref:Uncharacterized protein n=1 Tax=Rhizophora mucronata TaxID=61149 RepID=A0A2P2NU48_RHIMU